MPWNFVLPSAHPGVLVIALLDAEHHSTPSDFNDDHSTGIIDNEEWLLQEHATNVTVTQHLVPILSLYNINEIRIIESDGPTTYSMTQWETVQAYFQQRLEAIQLISRQDTYYDRRSKSYSRTIKICSVIPDGYDDVMWDVLNFFWDTRHGEYEFYSSGRSGGQAIPKSSIQFLGDGAELENEITTTLLDVRDALVRFNDEVDRCIADFVHECECLRDERADTVTALLSECVIPPWIALTTKEFKRVEGIDKVEFNAAMITHANNQPIFTANVTVFQDPDEYDGDENGWTTPARYNPRHLLIEDAPDCQTAINWFVESIEDMLPAPTS